MPSACAFGVVLRWKRGLGVSGWRGSFHELRDGFLQGWEHRGTHGLILVEMRREHTGQKKEEAQNQPLVMDLTFQETSGVHLHVGSESLSCGPELGTFPTAGWAARDKTKLVREESMGGLREGKGSLGGHPEEVEG